MISNDEGEAFSEHVDATASRSSREVANLE
jgi:hypothetical protein